MSKIIGIDLGTTNSGVAVWQDGVPHLISDREDYCLTPSAIAFDHEQEKWVVGRPALTLLPRTPQWVVTSIKRFIGRRFSKQKVLEELKKLHVLYGMEESKKRKGSMDVILGTQHLTPQEVSARILQKLKADAEEYLREEVTKAVITVPAYFNAAQRQATRDAGRIAGLEVKRVLNEPTAAYLAFGFSRLAEERKTVAVYDLGGGTFDISILEVGRGPFSVLATNGNTLLGGDDLDWSIVDWIIEQIGSSERENLANDIIAQAQLFVAAERAKIDLSQKEETTISIPGQLSPTSGITDFVQPFTRMKLEELAQPFIAKTLEPCARALHDAEVGASDIKEVLLVGGQTRMPAIRQAVEKFFHIPPNVSVNPDEVVALGAAVQAAMLAGETETSEIVLCDVVPLSLGVKIRGGMMDTVIHRNTSLPISVTVEDKYTTSADNQDSVEIEVYQGEHPEVSQNVKLGYFTLSGIEPAPAGQPKIIVTFAVDVNGILTVEAKDRYTGQSQKIVITDSVRLSDEEIKAMIRDAEEHAAEYAAQRHQLELREQAEQLLKRLNAAIASKDEALPEELKTKIQHVQNVPAGKELESYITNLRNLWKRVTESI